MENWGLLVLKRIGLWATNFHNKWKPVERFQLANKFLLWLFRSWKKRMSSKRWEFRHGSRVADRERTDLWVPCLYTRRWQDSHLAWCASLCATHDACPPGRHFRRFIWHLGRDSVPVCVWCHYAISSILDAVGSAHKRQELCSSNHWWFTPLIHSFIHLFIHPLLQTVFLVSSMQTVVCPLAN